MGRVFSTEAILTVVTYLRISHEASIEAREILLYMTGTESWSGHYQQSRAHDNCRDSLIQQYPELYDAIPRNITREEGPGWFRYQVIRLGESLPVEPIRNYLHMSEKEAKVWLTGEDTDPLANIPPHILQKYLD